MLCWFCLLAGCAGPRPLGELLLFARAQDGAGLPAVTDLLKEGDPVERAHAAFALGQLGAAWDAVEEDIRATAERALLEQGAREPEASVRDRVVEALGKLGSAAGLPFLIRSLDGGERARAAVALGLLFKNGRLKEPVAVPRLIALLDDGDAEVRWAAAYALFRMKAGDARAALVSHLADSSWPVRATSARALGELGAAGAPLLPLVEDADERVAAEAGRALAKSAVACAPDADCAALALLGRSGPWRPAVAAAIAAEPITHPSAAALFAARAGGDCPVGAGSRPGARQRRPDRALRRRRAAPRRADGARAGRSPRPKIRPRRHALAALLDHRDAAVRAQAAEALGKLDLARRRRAAGAAPDRRERPGGAGRADGSGVGAPALGLELTVMRRLGALANSHGPDSVEAIQALAEAAGAFGVRESIPILLQLAEDPVAAVRSAAAKGCARWARRRRACA